MHLPDDQTYAKNDIGLVYLFNPIPLTEDIKLICLPFDDRDYYGVPLTASGWGFTDDNSQDFSIKLQSVVLQESPIADCQRRNQPLVQIDPQMHICAGYGQRKGTYFGDSGGKKSFIF